MIASDTEKKIAQLHDWYCKRTGIVTKLFFARQLWFDRLRDCVYDAATLLNQCDLIIRYLKREIARDKRNLGSLRLSNFLQPDTFDENLGLAKLALSKNRTGRAQPQLARRGEGAPSLDPQPVGTADGTDIAEQLRKWRGQFTE
jgi:hypothetical protein